MRRLGAWWLMVCCVGVACCGCKQGAFSQGSVLGRTTVPPPGTGEAIPGAASPYYQTPGAAGPPAASTAPPYEPPGGYDNSALPPANQGAMVPTDPSGLRWVQSRDGNMPSDLAGENVDRSATGRPGPFPSAEDAPVVGRLQIGGRRYEASAPPVSDEPAFAQHTEATALRIIEPSHDADSPAETVQLASGRAATRATDWREPEGAALRRVSHEEPQSDDADRRFVRANSPRGDRETALRATSRGPRNRRPAPYGHDANYTWLKGQLQRTDDNRQWMLRYVPPGRPEDAYGGAVALPDSAVMAGYTAGDFVAVQGELLADNSGAGAYPSYDIQRIKPLGRF